VAFPPDGKALARVSEDAVLIEPATGKEREVLSKDDGPFHRLAAGPGGRVLTWTEAEEMRVRVWDAAAGRVVAWWKDPVGDVRGLAVSPDGKWLAALVGDSKKGYAAKVWDVSGFELGK
jgi:WD40 repeat protein